MDFKTCNPINFKIDSGLKTFLIINNSLVFQNQFFSYQKHIMTTVLIYLIYAETIVIDLNY